MSASITRNVIPVRHASESAAVPLYSEAGGVLIDQSRAFGCVCAEDLIALPSPDLAANFSSLYSLMLSRRSVRSFCDREVPEDVVEQVIKASSTAPMGIPPNDESKYGLLAGARGGA